MKLKDEKNFPPEELAGGSAKAVDTFRGGSYIRVPGLMRKLPKSNERLPVAC